MTTYYEKLTLVQKQLKHSSAYNYIIIIIITILINDSAIRLFMKNKNNIFLIMNDIIYNWTIGWNINKQNVTKNVLVRKI